MENRHHSAPHCVSQPWENGPCMRLIVPLNHGRKGGCMRHILPSTMGEREAVCASFLTFSQRRRYTQGYIPWHGSEVYQGGTYPGMVGGYPGVYACIPPYVYPGVYACIPPYVHPGIPRCTLYPPSSRVHCHLYAGCAVKRPWAQYWE